MSQAFCPHKILCPPTGKVFFTSRLNRKRRTTLNYEKNSPRPIPRPRQTSEGAIAGGLQQFDVGKNRSRLTLLPKRLPQRTKPPRPCVKKPNVRRTRAIIPTHRSGPHGSRMSWASWRPKSHEAPVGFTRVHENAPGNRLPSHETTEVKKPTIRKTCFPRNRWGKRKFEVGSPATQYEVEAMLSPITVKVTDRERTRPPNEPSKALLGPASDLL